MRYRVIAFFSLVFSLLALCAPASAQDMPKNDVKGLFLLTDYPALSLRPGSTSSVNVKVQNYALPPERLQLSLSGVPTGWTATIMGGGQPIAAVMPATNANVAVEIRFDIPKEAQTGVSNVTLSAKGDKDTVTLPIAVTIATDLPAKLSLTPQLPELRGTSKTSFEYVINVKNDSGKKLTVALSAQAPQNFDATFTEQYGSQELNAVPIDPGQAKDVKLKVKPPNTVGAGKYKITARISAEDANVTADLGLDITGTPKLDVSGKEGVLSARAEAGKETTIPIIITNTGTAAAEDIELSGSGPSGWKVEINPKTVDRIPPNENKEVVATITPTGKAIAGDYVTTLRASARGEFNSATFRVAVTTSTLWGFVAFGLIGAALLLLVGSVIWFGRR